LPAARNRIFVKGVVAVAIALIHAGSVRAQGERPVTLDDALRTARERSRDVRAAREHLEQSRADLDRARALLLPTASFQGKYTHNSQQSVLDLSQEAAAAQLQAGVVADVLAAAPNGATSKALGQICMGQPLVTCAQGLSGGFGGSSSSGVAYFQRYDQLDATASLSVPLVVPYAYVQMDAAKQALASQARNADVTEAQILTQVAQAFYTAAGTDELEEARRHAVEVARKTLDDARARLEAGVVNRVEVMRAEQAVVRAEQALREAEDAAVSAHRSLRTVAQLDEPFRVVPAAPPPPLVEEEPQQVDLALRLRPELLALDAQLLSADKSRFSNVLKWAPTLSAFGVLRATNAQGLAPQPYTWAVGVQLDWLIYDGGLHQASERQFASVARETRLRLLQLRDSIADEVDSLRRALETRRHAVEAAARDVELSRQTLELVRTQHEAGTVTQLDLLNAQDALVAAEVALARSRFDLGLADVQLRRATGEFPGR